MKTEILNIEGKKIKEIELPKFFSSEIREDLISKVLEARKTFQPYSPSLVAGKQHSASSILDHRRHVWKSTYGRGSSRVPRKIMSRRGSRFNWVAAEIPSAVGGRRTHPPQIMSMINTKKINKKEEKIALFSAIAATANEKQLKNKYLTLNENKEKIAKLPIVVEGKITTLKTKALLSSLKNILGNLYGVAIQKKKVRSGIGKLRGRRYKKNAGLLLVIGKNEKLKTGGIEIKKANALNIVDLARGGQGRLTIYTENAINDLEARFETKVKVSDKDKKENKSKEKKK